MVVFLKTLKNLEICPLLCSAFFSVLWFPSRYMWFPGVTPTRDCTCRVWNWLLSTFIHLWSLPVILVFESHLLGIENFCFQCSIQLCLVPPCSFVSDSHLFLAVSQVTSFSVLHLSHWQGLWFSPFCYVKKKSMIFFLWLQLPEFLASVGSLFSLSIENIGHYFCISCIHSLFSGSPWSFNLKVVVGWGSVSIQLHGS